MRALSFLLVAGLVTTGCAPDADGEASETADEVTGSVVAPAAALEFDTSIVAEVSACPGCADVDGDGLNDAWEDAVTARFQPMLELDEEEKGLRDPDFRVGVAARVVPRPDDRSRIVVFFGFAWSEDYGACGFTDHHGDVERAVIELARTPGSLGRATIVKAYTASHEGDVTDKSRSYEGDAELRSKLEFLRMDEAPYYRWLLYTSRNKHGTFASKAACESRKIPCLADYCGADGVADKNELRRRPLLVNVGEPSRPRESDWSRLGYPGTDAWSAGSFCGTATSGDCDAAPRGTFVTDPFTKKDL